MSCVASTVFLNCVLLYIDTWPEKPWKRRLYEINDDDDGHPPLPRRAKVAQTPGRARDNVVGQWPDMTQSWPGYQKVANRSFSEYCRI